MRPHRRAAILLSVLLAAVSARPGAASAQVGAAGAAVPAVASAQIDSLRRDSINREFTRRMRLDSLRRDSIRIDAIFRKAVHDEISASRKLYASAYSGLTLILLALATGVLLMFCVIEIRRGHPPALERHWGGFGGAGGGWRMSPSLTYLLIALLFGILLTVLGGKVLDVGGSPSPKDRQPPADSSAAKH